MEKGLPKKIGVSYDKDTPDDTPKSIGTTEGSYTSYPLTNIENGPRFPRNILGIGKNGMVDYFKTIRWIFQTLKMSA